MPDETPTLSPGDRLRLHLAVFICGASVMVIEILGARLIGPHFGVSLFVWTSLITVTLIALALGYFFGGSLADKRPEQKVFYLLICAVGVAVLLIPLFRRPVIQVCGHLGLRFGSLMAATLLFMPSLFLLGMISPFAVRLEAKSVESVGRSAGRLYALSTVGSVVGSVLTGFFLIPSFRLPTTLWVLAGLLIVLGLAGWGLTKKRAPAVAAVLLLWLGSVFYSVLQKPPEALVELKPSAYGDLRVVEEGGTRYLLANGTIQTNLDLATMRTRSVYPYFMVSRLLMCQPEAESALILGLGGGSVSSMLQEKGVRTTSLELDPAVVDLARERFSFRGQVVVQDGRVFLEQTRDRFDFVIGDAFSGEQLALSLLSEEALHLIKRALNPKGILVINLGGFLEGEGTPAARAILATLRAQFAHSFALPAGRRKKDGTLDLWNLLLFASDAPLEAKKNQVQLETFDGKLPFAWGGHFPLEPAGPVLSDDFNPLDTLDLVVRERWRRNAREHLPRPLAEALAFE